MKYLENDRTSEIPFAVIEAYPFDLIDVRGNDAVDFLHRMSTNDFSQFPEHHVRHTLFITEKGRIIDAVWAIKTNESLFLAVSRGKSDELIHWLNRYIIMEDLILENVTDNHTVTVHFTEAGKPYGLAADYYSYPVYFELRLNSAPPSTALPLAFDSWRIDHGIPVAGREISQEYNPLELKLRDWISFSKGCYIGQEVIARLDTYNKVQRSLYHFATPHTVVEQEMLYDDAGTAVGKITSATTEVGIHKGLAVVKTKEPDLRCSVRSHVEGHTIALEPIVRKGVNGRN